MMALPSRNQPREPQGLGSLLIILLLATLPLSVISDESLSSSSSSLLNRKDVIATVVADYDMRNLGEEKTVDCSTADSCEKCVDLAKEKMDAGGDDNDQKMICIWKKDEKSCEEIAKDDVGDDDNKCDDAAAAAGGGGEGNIEGASGNQDGMVDGTGGKGGDADGTGSQGGTVDGDGAKSKKDINSTDTGEKKDDDETSSPTASPTQSNEAAADETSSPTASPTQSKGADDETSSPTTSPTQSKEANDETSSPTTSPTQGGKADDDETSAPTTSPTQSKEDNVETSSPTTSPTETKNEDTSSPTSQPTEAKKDNVDADGAGGIDGIDGAGGIDGIDGIDGAGGIDGIFDGGENVDGDTWGGGGGTMDGGEEDVDTESPTASPVQETNEQQDVTTPAPAPKPVPIYDDDDGGPIGAIMALLFMIACGVLAFKNRHKFLQLMDKAGGPGGPGGGFGGGFGSGSNSRHVAAKYHEVASDDDEEWGWGDDGIGEDTQVEMAPAFSNYSDDSSVNKRKKSSPSTSTPKLFGKGKSPSESNNTHVPRLPKPSQTSGVAPSPQLQSKKTPKGMSLSKAKPAMPLGSPPAPTSVPPAPPMSAPVPALPTTMPGGMRITSLGAKKPAAPKKQPTKPPSSAEDDIFASMGLSAKPAFSHTTTAPRTTTPLTTGSRWNTTTAATGASPAMTFGNNRPAMPTTTTSFAKPTTTSSAMKADSFADDDWGEDDDLDDLLDD